jgi:hypothetical protein
MGLADAARADEQHVIRRATLLDSMQSGEKVTEDVVVPDERASELLRVRQPQ